MADINYLSRGSLSPLDEDLLRAELALGAEHLPLLQEIQYLRQRNDTELDRWVTMIREDNLPRDAGVALKERIEEEVDEGIATSRRTMVLKMQEILATSGENLARLTDPQS